ncbi:MAG TPA: exonuclease domain-containing protein, partial [Aggregatilineales bacterium]|nr:exonuclease domain-containing protein [Aggregatilineales bacterium]
MNREIIALDCETTGLDMENDRITEIGMALCRGDEVVDTFQSLVNPEMEIPAKVVALTGITNQAVKDAPFMRDMLPEINTFIGDRPIVGHNLRFDLGMLMRYEVGTHNPIIDTYDLASFLLPTAGSYSLGAIVAQMQLTLDNAHRALDDAIASWEVYRRLWALLMEVDLEILREIMPQAEELEWNAVLMPLREAIRLRSGDAEDTPGFHEITWKKIIPDSQKAPQRTLHGRWTRLDVEELAHMISADGDLGQKMPGYEERPSQVTMLRKVTEAFNEGQHTFIEAPTGTGKSLAYLIPAVKWAKANNTPVVISTHTIALQEQLMSKDIPFLKNQLGMEFTVAPLMGRSNYLCPRRLEIMRNRVPASIEELRMMAKTLVWLSQDGTGVKNDLSLRGSVEYVTWNRMSAQDEDCTLGQCLVEMGGVCPYHQARRAAE